MKRKRTSLVWQISREDLQELVNQSNTLSEVLAYFNLKNKGNNFRTLKARFKEDGIDDSKFKNNFGRGGCWNLIPLEKILVEHSSYNRTQLKLRLIEVGLLENKCKLCGLGPEWYRQPLVMVLDHINGVSDDNRLNNLRLLCPNCNSQTDNFAGRNRRIHASISLCSCGKPKCRASELCINCSKNQPRPNRRKVKRPSKEELEELLWAKPTRQIAKDFGVSDKSVEKWSKFYGLSKPPRGYWNKIGQL